MNKFRQLRFHPLNSSIEAAQFLLQKWLVLLPVLTLGAIQSRIVQAPQCLIAVSVWPTGGTTHPITFWRKMTQWP